MGTLIYLSTFPEWLFLQINQTATVTSTHIHGEDHWLYAGDELVGINFRVESSWKNVLPFGILRRLPDTLLVDLEKRLEAAPHTFSLRPYRSGFVKAKVIEKIPHPDSDHLFVCQVSLGTEKRQVVTNSTTVAEGHGVVVALSGAILLDGTMLETTLMLKQKTEGMFCSQKTLGIEPITMHGVMTFTWNDTELGDDYYA